MNVRALSDHSAVIDDREERSVQILLLGLWHRRTPDLAHTACGVPFHAEFTPIRRETLYGNLCGVCFTDYERGRAKTIRDPDEGDE